MGMPVRGFDVLRPLIRDAAMLLPPLRRLVEQRDMLLRDLQKLQRETIPELSGQRNTTLNELRELQGYVDELSGQRNTALNELRELQGYVDELSGQRNTALNELRELQDHVDEWRSALRPFPDHTSDMDQWFLPPGAHVAAAPQRYTDNYQRYVERGGKMRHEDVAGFVHRNPYYAFDRIRFYFFNLVFDLIAADGLAGDMAELGVDKGNSASVLAVAAQRLGKTIYLLDTFEGFPERDLVGTEERHRGGYTDTSLDLVKSLVTGEQVRFIKGYFPDSTVQLPDDLNFCLVHLDCDLYKPFACALNYFWPRLVPGGFLVMHDYTTLYWEGVEKAVDEFFKTKTESIIPIPDVSGTVAVRKAK
jgi:O-methyltransferase